MADAVIEAKQGEILGENNVEESASEESDVSMQDALNEQEVYMAITASMVKELREMTGCGMLDCKKGT